MSDAPWMLRAEAGLSAHFKQADGSSEPGTDWRITLTRDGETHTAFVRTYAAADLAPELKRDNAYMAQTAMGYLNDLLNAGWHPSQPREHAITVGNPPGGPSRKKPFWKFW